MITRDEEHAAQCLGLADGQEGWFGSPDQDIAWIEVADFGLSRLPQIGGQILTLEANPWVAVKVISMPWQLEPQHRHPPCEAEHYPGKTEVLRGQWGELYHYSEGPDTPRPQARPEQEDRKYLTVWNERILRPADQIVVPPNTWHWFQAGPEDAVVWTISSKATDAVDQWSDPRIVRKTVLAD